MIEYYQKRASEYELVYQKPERQPELRALEAWAKKAFSHEHVLEIACGTGYWTQWIASSAQSVLGMDVNSEVIRLASQKDFGEGNVRLEVADFDSFQPGTLCDSLFGGFIWSHIREEAVCDFVQRCLRWTKPGGRLVFLDNQFVDGSSTAISRRDAMGNSYQTRRLGNGEQFEILKNFPSQERVEELLDGMGLQVVWKDLQYYWLMELQPIG